MTTLTFSLLLVAPSLAGSDAGAKLEQVLNTHDDAAIERAVDDRALVRRTGLSAAERWKARADLRRGTISLAAQVEHDERFTLLHGDDAQATYRALDARGTVDYLFVDLTPAGKVADWIWLSDGRQASDHLAPQAPPRRATTSDLIVQPAPEATPSDLQQLELRVDDRDWGAFEASLERLDTAVGGDPWLTVLRGMAASAQGRGAEGTAMIEAARSQDESLVEQAFLPGHGGDAARW